jgi:hypothetical protein
VETRRRRRNWRWSKGIGDREGEVIVFVLGVAWSKTRLRNYGGDRERGGETIMVERHACSRCNTFMHDFKSFSPSHACAFYDIHWLDTSTTRTDRVQLSVHVRLTYTRACALSPNFHFLFLSARDQWYTQISTTLPDYTAMTNFNL